jgi:hypothetical protein
MNYELTPVAYLWDNGQIKLWLEGPKLPMGVKSIITPRPVYLGSPLIEAAPDLLDALQACNDAMEYMSEYDIPVTLPHQVKAAITKAKGETNET